MLEDARGLSGLPDPVEDAQFYDGVAFRRLLAWIVDFLITLALAIAAVIVTLGFAAFWIIPLWFVLGFVYRVIAISTWSATLGMRACGIELRNARGDLFETNEALAHTALYTGLFIIPFGILISAVMMLVGSRAQGLHDVILGTAAINRPESDIS